MQGISELKQRIKSVSDTRKITGALYMISSAHMRKAKQDLDRSLPYFEALRTEIKRVLRTVKNLENPYFYPTDMSRFVNGTYGMLVMTADKGLAGSYNQNVLRETMRIRSDHPDTRLFVIGEYGRQYFRKHGIPFEEDFVFSGQHPTLNEAREITRVLLDEYDSGALKKIFVIYTDMRKMNVTVRSSRLLPFHRAYFDNLKKESEARVKGEFVFYPSVENVLDSIIESYISGFVYGALVDSYCCEQSSRLAAMHAANESAKELMEALTLQLNHERQEAITEEISEVASGAKARQREKTKRRE